MHTWLLISVFFLSFVASIYYPKIAQKYGVIAKSNNRSLHSGETPRGAGIIVSITVIIAISLLLVTRSPIFSHIEFAIILCGGLIMATVGFLDDRYELSPKLRLGVQIFSATLITLGSGGVPPIDLGFATIDIGWFGIPIVIFMLVWFYNLFNFIDGIDGMAISSVIFASSTMTVVFILKGETSLAFLMGLLGCANLGLIYFNWPPAKFFIGDTGTNFNAFILSLIFVFSLWKAQPILWTWLIILGYYLVDTTMTTLLRIIKYPKTWYQPHRSHAYQNLARIWNNHFKVLRLVWSINICWLLPLAILAYYKPHLGMLFLAIAYTPLIIFVIRYGPFNKD